MTSPTTIQRLESAAIAVLIIGVIVALGYAWWWPLVLFLLFDVSMIGYLTNTAWGARLYNLGHSYLAPALLAGAYAALAVAGHTVAWIGIVAFSWMFHIAVDRALGYGLKHDDSFRHTHLGTIGSATPAA